MVWHNPSSSGLRRKLGEVALLLIGLTKSSFDHSSVIESRALANCELSAKPNRLPHTSASTPRTRAESITEKYTYCSFCTSHSKGWHIYVETLLVCQTVVCKSTVHPNCTVYTSTDSLSSSTPPPPPLPTSSADYSHSPSLIILASSCIHTALYLTLCLELTQITPPPPLSILPLSHSSLSIAGCRWLHGGGGGGWSQVKKANTWSFPSSHLFSTEGEGLFFSPFQSRLQYTVYMYSVVYEMNGK